MNFRAVRTALALAAGLAIALSSQVRAQSGEPAFGAGGPPELPRASRIAMPDVALGLEAEYDSGRDYTTRAAFLADLGRQKEIWTLSTRFANCSIGFNEERVRELLDQAVEKNGRKKLDMKDFMKRNRGCVAVAGAFDRDFMRGTMAEALLTSPENSSVIPQSGDVDAVKAFIKAIKAPSTKTDDPFVMGQLAAECRVGFAPAQVRALIATQPGSDTEKGAFAVLKAVTPQCDSFAVADKPLTAYFERAYAAQALYHWIGLAEDL